MPSNRSTSIVRQEPRPATAKPAPATALTRSAVHRKLPAAIRTQVDEAILMRPKGLPTLETISAHFDLPHHGITLPALRAYAHRLENLARPAAAGQILAIIFGSLPPSYRRRMRNGTEVLLLSRMAQMISMDTPQPLSVSELARLGPVLAAMSRHHRKRDGASAKQTHSRLLPGSPRAIQPSIVKGLVNDVYGVKVNVHDIVAADPGDQATTPPVGTPAGPQS